ncbi:MAG TPA: transglutaminase family protein [Mycobacteriales bacterium]|jgi:transglutaminase-like putative cysteine protease|nr:transglutaminase family protein [Mycobacteriales bacterium]
MSAQQANQERGTAPAGHLRLSSGVRYRLRQCFTYTYDGPATDLVHRLVVVPPAVHGDQRLRTGTVTVSDPAADVRWHDDAFGNRHCVVRLARVPARLELLVEVEVERGGLGGLLGRRPAPGSTARLRMPSALTGADDEIVALARRHAVPGDVLATADAYCALVRDRISYGFGATDVDSTAADALAAGTGVCQDQAHLMLALCRSAGIAARYVSGHLVGQGGTHAWTEVLVPGAGEAVAFDPCHARRADARYVTVAVGRDYRDVPPTSGSYEGSARGSLRTSRLLESVAA